MSDIRITLVQRAACPNAPDENIRLAEKLVREAAQKGTDLIVFPEMWSHAYAPPFPGAWDDPEDPAFERERRDWLDKAVPLGGVYVSAFQEMARQHSVGIVTTFLERTAGRPRNSALLLDRSGEILLHYSKVHTCDFSLEKLLEAGTDFPVATFDGVHLGVMICYDREFPESARLLMLGGAEIVLVPNACDMNPARLQQLSTRAFENMIGMAMANYPGPGWGHSCAFSPVVFDDQGYVDNRLAEAGEEEALLTVSFPLEKIRDYRRRETWGNAYRKPQAYGPLLDPTVREPFCR